MTRRLLDGVYDAGTFEIGTVGSIRKGKYLMDAGASSGDLECPQRRVGLIFIFDPPRSCGTATIGALAMGGGPWTYSSRRSRCTSSGLDTWPRRDRPRQGTPAALSYLCSGPTADSRSRTAIWHRTQSSRRSGWSGGQGRALAATTSALTCRRIPTGATERSGPCNRATGRCRQGDARVRRRGTLVGGA